MLIGLKRSFTRPFFSFIGSPAALADRNAVNQRCPAGHTLYRAHGSIAVTVPPRAATALSQAILKILEKNVSFGNPFRRKRVHEVDILDSGNLLRVHLLDLVYENNPDTVPSLEQLYAMLLETLEKLPENH